MPESFSGNAASGTTASADPSREDASADDLAKAAPDPLIGKIVNGRFRIVSVIARGGMGKVYKAEQAPLGRVCALKVLSPKYEGDKDPEFHKRFFLEAATAAKLTHPNTVTIFDYGTDGDIYYMAMEYIEGRTLFRALRDEGPFPEARTAHIARQICRALREAHGHGVVHRDLKPGNVLISTHGDEKDYVKVLDFGLVKDVTGEKEDLTQQGLFMGSPKYMAPEQILGGEISPRTDVYALGIMMYEMLCGRVPFDRGAGVGTLMAHVHNAPPPMQSYFPEIALSQGMEAIVFRCLEKDPGRRFASMNDLLTALKYIGGDDSMGDPHDSLSGSMISHSPRSMLRSGISRPPYDSSPQSHYPVSRREHSGPITGPISGPGIRPTSTYPGVPPGPISTDGRVFASPSNSDISAGPPPYPSYPGMLPQQSGKKRIFPWVIAGAMALVTIAVVISSRSSATKSAPATDPTTGGTAAALAPSTASPIVSPPPSAAEPLPRRVRVESAPAGAAVKEGDKQVCDATPCELVWKGDEAKADHKLSFAKTGYKSQSVTVSADDEKVSATLTPVAASGPKPGVPTGYKDAY